MLDAQHYQLPIRVRLTLWYVVLMAITFAAFGFVLLTRFQLSLRNTIDASLQIAVSQSIATMDPDEPLIFQIEGGVQTIALPLPMMNYAMRMISPQGIVQDSYGNTRAVPGWGPAESGYHTQSAGSGAEQWRILCQPLRDTNGRLIGWLQAAQSMQYIDATLQNLSAQLLWGIPLIVVLAGLGGYFLANRALRPINQIANTAQAISASDLSRRLAYRGPADEVGRLAYTFDQMLARLQEAFERERRFIGDAAHELRTPLTALKGQIEVTLGRPRQCNEYISKLQELAGQVDRLIRLSNALFFISLTDQSRLPWQPALLNLEELLGVIIEQIHPLAQEKALVVQAEFPAEPLVYGDFDQLTRLFLNLLDNAVKYTPAGGRISLLAMKDANGVQIMIQNSGPAIAPEHLQHLFERFFRVDDDRSETTGGAGLGLAIAQEIVRRHNGTISVQSEPAKGTTFTIWLPSHYVTNS